MQEQKGRVEVLWMGKKKWKKGETIGNWKENRKQITSELCREKRMNDLERKHNGDEEREYTFTRKVKYTVIDYIIKDRETKE